MTPYKFAFPWPIAIILFCIQVVLMILKMVGFISIPWVLVLLPVLLYGGIGFLFVGALIIKVILA